MPKSLHVEIKFRKYQLDYYTKALIMEDEKGVVTLSYNDPKYIGKRHSIKGCDKVLTKISGILSKFAKGATSK